jgi:hypothetical protein
MKTIKLEYPIQHGENVISELNLRRPVSKDLRKFEITDMNKFSKIQEIVSIITQLPMSVLDNLDIYDLRECAAILTSFFLNSRAIQENV